MIRGCAKGKAKYQEMLYHQHYQVMFGVCIRYCKDRDLAEDVMQEGFIKVFQNIAKYRGGGSLEGWIRRIMVNTALEHHRKAARFFPVTDLEEAMAEDAGHDVVAKMSGDEILVLIQELPDGYRTVFNLFGIEGYSHREIATMLNISEGTSKSQFARARKQLQEKVIALQGDNYGKAKSV